MEELRMNDMEISAIGEIANITMGNAATTLGILLRDNIEISVPQVTVKKKEEIQGEDTEMVITKVNYVKGIQGCSVMFLTQDEVKMMADIMMGGDGAGMFFQQELGELHLSAVSESMNQMMGSEATAMGIMLDRLVDISTPVVKVEKAEKYLETEFPGETNFAEISFDVHLGAKISCRMVQVYPFMLAKAIADLFLIKKANEKN